MPHLAAILLPSPIGHHFYTTCYVLAFLLNQALLLWVGHRRGYPLRAWLLLTTAATLAFIVGTKLIAVPAADWPALWQPGHWSTGTARSVLGGAVSGALAVLALRRWLGFDRHVFDAFSLPMCAAYVVQCVGCLLTGCCFGHLAPAGWGVHYAPNTLPFMVQVERGLILPTAAHSLPVLPTQLLMALLALGVGVVLWRTRQRPWPGGSWRLLHVGLLLLGRFVVEFWRDPAGEQVGAALRPLAGLALKQVQWALLPLTLLFLGWWWRRTRPRAERPAAELIPANQPQRNLLTVVGLLAATALLGPGALTLPEMLVVKAGLTVVLVLELLTLLQQGSARQWSLPLGLASVVLLFTNQAPAPTDSTGGRRYLTLGVGGLRGAYDQDIVEGGGCSGARTRTAYYHRYAAVGGSVEYGLRNPSRSFRALGLGVWGGSERIGAQSIDPDGPFVTTGEDGHLRRPLWDMNPYVEFRSPDGGGWEFGYRLGMHLGRLSNGARILRREDPEQTVRPLQVLPEFMIWTGVRRTAFFQFDGGLGPLTAGNYAFRGGIGTGFGSTEGSHLLAGLAVANHAPQPAMAFVGGQLRLGHTGLLLEPYAATDFGRHYQLNGQLRYALPLNKRR